MIPSHVTAMKSLLGLWRRFGSIRLVSEVPQIIEGMKICDRAIAEQESGPRRFDLINLAIQNRGYTTYLEIGVRNPADCFDRIRIQRKWSVDPGVEFRANPVDFAMTSDQFFELCDRCMPSECPSQWDVVFIDGMHRAEQVARDIKNAARYLRPGGMIFLHDCLPPTETHARERFGWALESGNCWNGTSWKAFARYLHVGRWRAFIVQTDWGVGVIDSAHAADENARLESNEFYEFDTFVRGIESGQHLLSVQAFAASFGAK